MLRLYNAGREGTGDTLRVITELQRDAETVASNSSDLRIRPDLPPVAKLEPLAEERFDDVDIFGRLRLVDEVICADLNTPHSFRQGGRGLFNKLTSEPLGYYGGRDRLSYDWHLEYRDDRDEFSRIETILGKDCRVTEEWGWFAYHMGRDSLEPGKYYVMEIEYPEDTSRQFLIWNRLDVSASFGFHTGSALGDAPARQRFMQRVDLPLSNQYQRHYSLLRAIATEGWVGLHTLGGSSTPFSEGLAVHAIRIYELGDTQALENLALEVNEPEGLPRRTLGFIHEDANPAAHVLHKYRFWGLNMYTPVTLMYGGYAWGGHTGWIGWDTSLYGPENLRHTFAIKHPSYFNHRPGPPEDVIIEAERLGMQAFTLLEYTGTGQLPPEAFATWPDGSIRGFAGGTTLGPDGLRTMRYYDDTATVDMAHPAVGEDLAKLVTEVATLYSRHASFKGVVLTHRFQAWQIGYGEDSLNRFAAEKGLTLPPENAGQWVYDNHRDAYYAWHREQKRLNLLQARDALQAVDPNLQLMIMNYNAGDDNLHFGSPLYWWDKPEGDEFMTPNEVSFPDFSTIDLAALIEDYTRPDIATLSPGMNPPLYSEDRGIWNLAMSRYPFLSDNPDYLNHFRTGEGSAVVVWWVYNEDAFNNHREIGWNCPGLHGNEGSGRYSMLDEVQIMAAGDPFVLAVRIGHLNRGYPRYAREFAAAYRALPAVPSEIVPSGDNPDVVVRRYDTANGIYLALIHKGLGPADATVTLTREIAGGAVVHNLVTGERITIGAGTELHLPPVSLTSLQVVNE